MPTFAERLEEALVLRDMSPADLSRATGIGEGAISQYRKGSCKAAQKNLEKIAQALCVPIPWLMGVADKIKEVADVSPLPDVPADPNLQQLTENYLSLNPDGQAELLKHSILLIQSGLYIKRADLPARQA